MSKITNEKDRDPHLKAIFFDLLSNILNLVDWLITVCQIEVTLLLRFTQQAVTPE
tara:strand:- start:11514 stop:11678 length:165 start_codon:yes stop_codon:yes gene_type:complete